MTSGKLLDLWLKFWFDPQSPTPVALFRICFGILLLLSILIHVGSDVFLWYGPHSPIPLQAIKSYWWWNEPHFDMLMLVPYTNQGVLGFFALYVVACICLTVGFYTRYAAIFVSLTLISMHNHQPFNINGGDSMMRLISMYLVFSEAGQAFSVDRLIKRYRDPTFGENSRTQPVAPLGQRMIQVQLAIAYAVTFFHKVSGPQWWDGTAVYYALRLDDMMNFTLPLLFDNMFVCKLLTWFTLVIEFALFTLIWVKDLRYFVLAAGACLHLGIDFAMQLPVFEWTFITSYLTFVDPREPRNSSSTFSENDCFSHATA